MIRVYGRNEGDWQRLTPDLPEEQLEPAVVHHAREWERVQARRPYFLPDGTESETIVETRERGKQ